MSNPVHNSRCPLPHRQSIAFEPSAAAAPPGVARVRSRSVTASLCLLRLAAALSALTVVPASATNQEACVANHTDLVDALELATTAPVTIKIAQGTYDLIGTSLTHSPEGAPLAAGTRLLGGYTGSQCASRDIAFNNTVLNNSAALGPGIILLGSLTIEGLTWHANPDIDVVTHAMPAGTEIVIRRSAFIDSQQGVAFRWFQDADSGTSLRVVNSIFAGLNASGIALFSLSNDLSDPGATPSISLINNTVVGNTQGFGVRIGGGHTHVYAVNNIFYGNYGGFGGPGSAFDIYSDSDQFVLVDNILGNAVYPTQMIAPIGTLNSDPQLAANYRPIEAFPSPAINSGTSTVTGGLPATDIDGRDREIGSAPDRGAYESNVNNSNVIQVTNANDSGASSLRAAIVQANGDAGFNVIEFAIGTGCGPKVITLNSPLPGITDNVRIDGYSQPGAARNDRDYGDNAALCIILDGAANAIGRGLSVPGNAGANTFVEIEGIGFSGFTDAAINLAGGSKHRVVGNHIGGGIAGFSLTPSSNGVVVGAGVSDVTIGGDDSASRNIIGATLIDGLYFSAANGATPASNNNQVVNNYIGVGWSAANEAYVNRGNGAKGIRVLGVNNEISGNLIGYSGSDGIDLGGDGNTVENNQIGTDLDDANLPNGSMGVRVENAANDNTIRLNTIGMNAGTGVRVVNGQRNTIRRNRIVQNGSYGIDLAVGGVTPNDDDGALQQTDYANRGQNFPVLTAAAGSTRGGTVSGTLTSTLGTFTVDVYSSANCDGSGYGEGTRWLGSVTLTINVGIGGQGSASFNIPFALNFPGTIAVNAAVTATATDAVGNTSEFSACLPYTNDVIFADDFE